MLRGHGGGRCAGPGPSSALIVRPVYGLHLKQILITMGGMIVGEEIIKAIWGPLQIAMPLPRGAARQRSCIGEAARSRSTGCWPLAIGLLVFVPRWLWTLARTKVGLLIRAGVQDREMVESRWATASGACSWACSSPGRRWPGWAA